MGVLLAAVTHGLSLPDFPSMTCLHEGWMDGRIGCKVFQILAQKRVYFIFIKNAPEDGIVFKTKYFDNFLRNGLKNRLKVSKQWHKGCFLEFKNYHILRYDIYEFLKKVWGGP